MTETTVGLLPFFELGRVGMDTEEEKEKEGKGETETAYSMESMWGQGKTLMGGIRRSPQAIFGRGPCIHLFGGAFLPLFVARGPHVCDSRFLVVLGVP